MATVWLPSMKVSVCARLLLVKVECGLSLCVLGVALELSADGLRCRPSADKASKWGTQLVEAIESLHLSPSNASKLSGKLSWGCSHMFRKR